MDTTVLQGFFNEIGRVSSPGMEKAARSYVRDFLGGVDPTGGSTFQYGMSDVEKGRKSPGLRRAVGTVGGAAGGMVAVPAAIGGIIGSARGAFQGGGGVRGRLARAGRGLVSGAASPFSRIYHAARAKGALKAVEAGGKLSSQHLKDVHNLAKATPGVNQLLSAATPVAQAVGKAAGKASRSAASAQDLLQRQLTPEVAGKLRKVVGGELGTGVAALGTSGLIGGGSAYLQYGKGRMAAQRYQQKAPPAATQKTASISGALLRGVATRAAKRPVETVILARGAKGRVRRGKERHQETMRALDERNPYPAGWVPLGMRPRRG